MALIISFLEVMQVDYMVIFGISNLVFLLNDIENLQFNKLTFGSSNSIPRYGHSGTVYQKKLYIFGGKVKMQNFAYLADLDMYSLGKYYSYY